MFIKEEVLSNADQYRVPPIVLLTRETPIKRGIVVSLFQPI